MNNKNLLIIGGILAILVALVIVNNRSSTIKGYEGYANPRVQDISSTQPVGVSMITSSELGPAPIPYNENVLPYPQISNPYQQQSEYVPPLPCEGKDVLNPKELLPVQQPNSPWNLSNPQVPSPLEGKNFLESTANFGIDTVGSSLRNANYQIRSDPYIQPAESGPWSQSTIAPDTSHRYFEVGSS
jgi:hypothetical protein